MKKILYIIIITAATLFSGCSDFLNEVNKSSANAEEYYATASGYESLINACYSTLRDVYGDNIEVFEAGTDSYESRVELD